MVDGRENFSNYATDADLGEVESHNNMRHDPSFSLVGYRAPPKLASASMLSNLGSNILQQVCFFDRNSMFSMSK